MVASVPHRAAAICGTAARVTLLGHHRSPPRRDNPNPRKPVVCHKCGKEGHFARGCAARRSRPTAGKLGTLGAKGRACEGNPIQASPEHLNNFIVNVNAAMSSFYSISKTFSYVILKQFIILRILLFYREGPDIELFKQW